VFKYDTVADEWSTMAPMPHACSCHSASVLDGLVYIVGAGESRHEVLRFDLPSGVWSTLAPTENSRDIGSSFVLGGCLYAVGDEAYSARVASNTRADVADMLEGRGFNSAATICSTNPADEQDFFDALIANAPSECPWA
jgi:hypothetical protein